MASPKALFLLGVLPIVLIAGCAAAPPIAPANCTANWTCTDWGACSNSTQTRTCNDTAACNTTAGKPEESQSCAPTITHYSGNISQLKLEKGELGLEERFWSRQREAILNDSYALDIDKQDGWEAGYRVSYHYDDASIIPELRATQAFHPFDLYHVIAAFPIVDGESNSTFISWLKSGDLGVQKLVIYDDINKLQEKSLVGDFASLEFEQLPDFGVADEEFVYRFNLTNNQFLYGIVLSDSAQGILEKLWISGYRTDADILLELIQSAAAKVG